MEQIQLLGAALGLGVLSGVSLYLTVFVVGLSLHEGWLHLSAGMEPLQVLQDPWIWGVALVFYLVEFFADKVPWVDSVWDAFHTAIRPIGAMFVASAVLGEAHPAMEILGILCAGTAAVSSHSAKAGLRLFINASPEPFSNIATSVAEDVFVVAGSVLVVQHPIVALFITAIAVGTFVYFAPALGRAIRAQFHLIFGKLGARPGGGRSLAANLPHQADMSLAGHLAAGEKVLWSVPCLTGRFPTVGRNVRGHLVRTTDAARLYFVGRKSFKPVVQTIPIEATRMDFQQRFLCDELTFYRSPSGLVANLRFVKRDGAQAQACHEALSGASSPALKTEAAAPAGAAAAAMG